jgi:hypothetical protein
MSLETRRQRHKEVVKVKNKQSLNRNLCKLQDLAEEKGYTLVHITPYQVRVNNKVDIYPTRLKYFHLATKEWGTLSEDMFEQKIIKLINR